MKAFPSEDSKWNEYADDYIKVRHTGMDLRDYFAAKALQGILSCNYSVDEEPAILAYQYADEMMKAREKND